MGQLNTRHTNRTGGNNDERIKSVLTEIENEIKEGKKLLEMLRKREKHDKEDISKIKRTIEHIESNCHSRIKFLDWKNASTPPNTASIDPQNVFDTRAVLEGLQEECTRLTEIVNNMRENKKLNYEDVLYLVGEVQETITRLHQMKNIEDTAANPSPDDQSSKGVTNTKSSASGTSSSSNDSLAPETLSICERATHMETDNTLKKVDEANGYEYKTTTETETKVNESASKITIKCYASKGGYAKIGEDDVKKNPDHMSTKAQQPEGMSFFQRQDKKRDETFNQQSETINRLERENNTLLASREQNAKPATDLELANVDMQKKLKTTEDNYKQMMEQHQAMAADNRRKLEDSEKKCRTETEKVKSATSKLNEQKRRSSELERKNKQLTEENQSLLNRLSKLAGEKLTNNNPNIADLSDKNRPTKLGEMYSELYDNEWTDAYDALQTAKHTDTDIIITLKATVENTFKFCEETSGRLKKKVSDAVNLLFDTTADETPIPEHHKVYANTCNVGRNTPTPGQKPASALPTLEVLRMRKMWKSNDKEQQSELSQMSMVKPKPVEAGSKIQALEKEVSESVVLIVQKEYFALMWDQECIPALKPYIKKCLYLCWMMIVQSPPMCFATDPKPGELLDTNVYRKYLSSEKFVDYVVWPALLLHKDGPLVCKGVAETKSKE